MHFNTKNSPKAGSHPGSLYTRLFPEHRLRNRQSATLSRRELRLIVAEMLG